MALPATLETRRFELFYGSLVVCGIVMAAGQLPSLLAVSGPADVSPIGAVIAIAGIGIAISSVREAFHRDRAEWEAEFDESLVVGVVIGAGLLVAAIAIYWLLTL